MATRSASSRKGQTSSSNGTPLSRIDVRSLEKTPFSSAFAAKKETAANATTRIEMMDT
ncbi:MAG: hypothetical protein HGB11_14680 [Chlorobiales bacterium]|nr:hypothetical protein [Chlorobiales bacterium]